MRNEHGIVVVQNKKSQRPKVKTKPNPKSPNLSKSENSKVSNPEVSKSQRSCHIKNIKVPKRRSARVQKSNTPSADKSQSPMIQTIKRSEIQKPEHPKVPQNPKFTKSKDPCSKTQNPEITNSQSQTIMCIINRLLYWCISCLSGD